MRKSSREIPRPAALGNLASAVMIRKLGQNGAWMNEAIIEGRIVVAAARWRNGVSVQAVDVKAWCSPPVAPVCRVVPAQLGDAIGDHAALSAGIDGLARLR